MMSRNNPQVSGGTIRISDQQAASEEHRGARENENGVSPTRSLVLTGPSGVGRVHFSLRFRFTHHPWPVATAHSPQRNYAIVA